MYIRVGETLLRADKIESVMSVMPKSNEIVDHFYVCEVKNKFIPIRVEVEKEKFNKICSDVIRTSSQKLKVEWIKQLPIVLDSNTKSIIFISKKNG